MKHKMSYNPKDKDNNFVCPICGLVEAAKKEKFPLKFALDHIAEHEGNLLSREYWIAKSEAGYRITKEDMVKGLLGDDTRGIDYALPREWVEYMATKFNCHPDYIKSQFVWYCNVPEAFGIPFPLTTNAERMLHHA